MCSRGPGPGSCRIGSAGNPSSSLSCIGLSIVMLLTTVYWLREFWVAYLLYFATMVLVAMRLSPFSALLTALVSDERRGSLMSMTIALGQVGFAVGAAGAGPLYSRFGYGSNTVVGAAAVLIMAGIVGYLVPEPELYAEPPAERVDDPLLGRPATS